LFLRINKAEFRTTNTGKGTATASKTILISTITPIRRHRQYNKDCKMTSV
jgi:hypothetical protein